MDRRTSEGLKVYQQLQMLADSANIDPETRAALLGDSREQDFRALLRVLRERVVDATGLLEDGSALGVAGSGAGARARQPPSFSRSPRHRAPPSPPRRRPPPDNAGAAVGRCRDRTQAAAPAEAAARGCRRRVGQDRPRARF